MKTPQSVTAELWMKQLFSAKAVNCGGILRRSASDVDRLIGRDVFLAEIHARGYRAIENNGQIVILCNRAPIEVLA